MRLMPDEANGVAAMEALKSFPPPTVSELQILYEKCRSLSVLQLRVLDLGSYFESTQAWTSEKLRELVADLKTDPLALVNVLELISSLPNDIIRESINDLCVMLEDPIIQTMDIFLSYFLRLFTNYYSKSSEEMPRWYIDLLLKDDIPIELFLTTIKFLFENRPDLENQFRTQTNLAEILAANTKTPF